MGYAIRRHALGASGSTQGAKRSTYGASAASRGSVTSARVKSVENTLFAAIGRHLAKKQGIDESKPVVIPAKYATDPPGEPNKYHRERVFFLLMELSKNDDFISNGLHFQSKVRYSVSSTTTAALLSQEVSIVPQTTSSGQAGTTLEQKANAVAGNAIALLNDASRHGEAAYASVLSYADKVPGATDAISGAAEQGAQYASEVFANLKDAGVDLANEATSAILDVVSSIAPDAMSVANDVLNVIGPAIPIVGTALQIVGGIVAALNQSSAQFQSQTQALIEKARKEIGEQAALMAQECANSLVQVTNDRGDGGIWPADIFRVNQDGKTPDLGVALMSITNPDTSDLEAIRWVNDGYSGVIPLLSWPNSSLASYQNELSSYLNDPNAWKKRNSGGRSDWQSVTFQCDPVHPLRLDLRDWLSVRPTLRSQPVAKVNSSAWKMGVAPWSMAIASERISQTHKSDCKFYTPNFNVFEQIYGRWGGGGTEFRCAGSCQLTKYDGSVGREFDTFVQSTQAYMRKEGFPELAKELPQGLAIRTSPLPRNTSQASKTSAGVVTYLKWPDPLIRTLKGPVIRRLSYDVSPRTRSLFKLMVQLIREEDPTGQSANVLSPNYPYRKTFDYGKTIFPFFLDLLLYELNKGRISDGAVVAILARHFPCFDYNQAPVEYFYSLLEQWQDQNAARTPDAVTFHEKVKSTLFDLSDKLISDPESLVGKTDDSGQLLVPKSVLDAYITEYRRRKALRPQKAVTLQSNIANTFARQSSLDFASGNGKTEAEGGGGGVVALALLSAVAIAGGVVYYKSRKKKRA